MPFGRITFAERVADDPTKIHRYHDIGTDDRGRGYFELSGLFTLSCSTLPVCIARDDDDVAGIGRFANPKDMIRAAVRSSSSERVIPFPWGRGKCAVAFTINMAGPVTEYFLTLAIIGVRQSNDDATEFALRLPVIDSDGRFEVPGLVAGTYTMMVRHFDYSTYAWTFDGPKVIVLRPVEVKSTSKSRLRNYSMAGPCSMTASPSILGDVRPGFTHDPKSRFGGTSFDINTESDGTFRVSLSREERRLLDENSAGMIEVYAYGEKHQKLAEVKVRFEKLSRQSRVQPTKVILPRPDAKKDAGQAVGGEPPKPIEPTADELQTATKAFEELQGKLRIYVDRHSKQTKYRFGMPKATVDGDLKKIPDLPFSFGLMLFGTNVTDAGLKDLGNLENLTSLNLMYTKVTDAGLKDLANLKNLSQFALDGTGVTDLGLKELGAFKNLTELDLRRTKVTDAGLKELTNLKHLWSLELSSCQNVADAGIEELARLNNLSNLGLAETSIGDAELKEIAKLQNLSSLDLMGCSRLTDVGFKELGKLKNLSSLNLAFCHKLTDAALVEVGNLENLSNLNLALCSRVTDAGLKELTKLKKLSSLDLYDTAVTDVRLKDLANFKNLTKLRLKRGKVTEAAAAELKRALSELTITW